MALSEARKGKEAAGSIEFFKAETQKTKETSYLVKLELEKSHMLMQKADIELQELVKKNAQLAARVESQDEELQATRAKLSVYEKLDPSSFSNEFEDFADGDALSLKERNEELEAELALLKEAHQDGFDAGVKLLELEQRKQEAQHEANQAKEMTKLVKAQLESIRNQNSDLKDQVENKLEESSQSSAATNIKN